MSTTTNEVNENKIGSLMADLTSDHGLTRQHARESLVALGEPAVAPLIAALADPNRQVRWEVVKALGEIGDPTAAPALVSALEDEGSDIRWLDSEGLINMGREGLEPLLQALIHHSDSEWLREGAHHVLYELAERDMNELVSPVLRALEDIEPVIEVPPVAQAALNALKASA